MKNLNSDLILLLSQLAATAVTWLLARARAQAVCSDMSHPFCSLLHQCIVKECCRRWPMGGGVIDAMVATKKNDYKKEEHSIA